MPKLNTEEVNRLDELKLIIWSYHARESLQSNKKSDTIPEQTIESNRGRIGKALRLLGNYVTPCGTRTVSTSYGSTRKENAYKINNMGESQPLSKAPTFYTELPDIHDCIFYKYNIISQFQMDTIAYKDVCYLSSNEVLYVYWHREDYQIITEDDTTKIYPIALLETYTKAVLRTIIEQYFHTNFHSRIEKYLNIPENSLKHNDMFNPKIRNFSAHGFRFTKEKYFGHNGFMSEYTHYRDYFEALIKSLEVFHSKIQEAGGHEAVLENTRKEIISDLIENTPLKAFQPLKDKNLYSPVSIPEYFDNPYLNTYILRNSAYLTYDLLYGEDQSILFIDKENKCKTNQHDKVCEDTTYIPDQDELNLINGIKNV